MRATVISPFYLGGGEVAEAGSVVELGKGLFENLKHRGKVEEFVPLESPIDPAHEEPAVPIENRESDLHDKTKKRKAK